MKIGTLSLLFTLPLMAADVKFSELTSVSSPTDAAVLALADSGLSPASRKYLLTNLVKQSQMTSASLQTSLGQVYQGTNAALTALAGNPQLYQATNATLTSVAALADSTGALTNNGAGALGWFDLSVFAKAANLAMAVSNNVATSGLLAVDATKTNGIAATEAHVTNALGMNIVGQLALKLPVADPTFTGTLSGPTATIGTSWTQVTPDTTNSVINLAGASAGIAKNFYYSLSTSNYIIFSNLVVGAEGTIWVNCSGTPQTINFSSSYDNFSTNEIAAPFSVTNRAVIAYKVGWGTDATNVMLGIKRK